MVSGDKRLRSFNWPIPDNDKSSWTADQKSPLALAQKAIGFNCLNYGANPEASLYRHFLPDKNFLDTNCVDGLRLELMFPSCWNGKDLDSHDHRSHVAFPDLVMSGSCPEGYGVKLPSLFYETIFNTYAFKGMDGQFVLSTGDPTGFGYHGDFQMGWESSDFLQSAVDTCTNASGQIEDCPLFHIQSDADSQKCFFPEVDIVKGDNPLGPRDGLPINVPIQAGPAYATIYPVVLADQETQGSGPAPTPSPAPTLSYSAETSSFSVADSTTASSTITAAPSLTTDGSGNAISTSYYTSGNEIIEVIIEETDVTFTTTAIETASASVSVNAHYRRHIGKEHRRAVRDKHAHH
jgi:hypothetical protein